MVEYQVMPLMLGIERLISDDYTGEEKSCGDGKRQYIANNSCAVGVVDTTTATSNDESECSHNSAAQHMISAGTGMCGGSKSLVEERIAHENENERVALENERRALGNERAPLSVIPDEVLFNKDIMMYTMTFLERHPTIFNHAIPTKIVFHKATQ